MVFNATLNNISITSWLSVLLVEETGLSDPGETTDLSQVTDKLNQIMLYRVHKHEIFKNVRMIITLVFVSSILDRFLV
jgi:hypothetical protein